MGQVPIIAGTSEELIEISFCKTYTARTYWTFHTVLPAADIREEEPRNCGSEAPNWNYLMVSFLGFLAGEKSRAVPGYRQLIMDKAVVG